MSVSGASQGWTSTGRAPSDAALELWVGVKLQKMDELRAIVDDRSNPRSSAYTQWLTRDEVLKLTSPSEQVMLCAEKWIRSARGLDVKNVVNNSTFVVAGTVSAFEAWLEVDMHTFTSSDNRVIVRKSGAHVIPSVMADNIRFISGLAGIPLQKASQRLRRSASNSSLPPPIIQSTSLGSFAILKVRFQCPDGTAITANSTCASGDRVTGFQTRTSACMTVPNLVDPSGSCQSQNDVFYTFPADPLSGNNQTITVPVQQVSVVCVRIMYSTSVSSAEVCQPFFPAPIATPQFLAKLYNIPPRMTVKQKASNSVLQFHGSFSFKNDTPTQFNAFDLNKFFDATGVDSSKSTVSVYSVSRSNGQVNLFPQTRFDNTTVTDSGVEGALDIQLITAMAPGATTAYIDMVGYDDHNPMLANLRLVLDLLNITVGLIKLLNLTKLSLSLSLSLSLYFSLSLSFFLYLSL